MRIKNDTLQMMIEALCRDYSRRRDAIKEGKITRRTAMEYRYLNAAIRQAAEETVGERLAMAFIREIGEGRGYAKSELDCLSEGTYKVYKSSLIKAVARKLHLAD